MHIYHTRHVTLFRRNLDGKAKHSKISKQICFIIYCVVIVIDFICKLFEINAYPSYICKHSIKVHYSTYQGCTRYAKVDLLLLKFLTVLVYLLECNNIYLIFILDVVFTITSYTTNSNTHP